MNNYIAAQNHHQTTKFLYYQGSNLISPNIQWSYVKMISFAYYYLILMKTKK